MKAPSFSIPGVIHWGKLPVPYVAAWSSEIGMRIASDPTIGNHPALFRGGRRGDGTPTFGKMDEARTRVVVCKRLCQVCARPLGREGYVADRIYGVHGKQHPLIHEPLSCRRCFEVSVALCPGIAKMIDGPRTIVARVRTYQSVAVTLGIAHTPDADLELNDLLEHWTGAPVVGYVRPALVDYDVIPLPSIVCGRTS